MASAWPSRTAPSASAGSYPPAAISAPAQSGRKNSLAERVSAGEPSGLGPRLARPSIRRSEEHTSELQSLMRSSYAVFCLTKNKTNSTRFGPEMRKYVKAINTQEIYTDQNLIDRP